MMMLLFTTNRLEKTLSRIKIAEATLRENWKTIKENLPFYLSMLKNPSDWQYELKIWQINQQIKAREKRKKHRRQRLPQANNCSAP